MLYRVSFVADDRDSDPRFSVFVTPTKDTLQKSHMPTTEDAEQWTVLLENGNLSEGKAKESISLLYAFGTTHTEAIEQFQNFTTVCTFTFSKTSQITVAFLKTTEALGKYRDNCNRHQRNDPAYYARIGESACHALQEHLKDCTNTDAASKPPKFDLDFLITDFRRGKTLTDIDPIDCVKAAIAKQINGRGKHGRDPITDSDLLTPKKKAAKGDNSPIEKKASPGKVTPAVNKSVKYNLKEAGTSYKKTFSPEKIRGNKPPVLSFGETCIAWHVRGKCTFGSSCDRSNSHKHPSAEDKDKLDTYINEMIEKSLE
jgi:hypothetical protein